MIILLRDRPRGHLLVLWAEIDVALCYFDRPDKVRCLEVFTPASSIRVVSYPSF